MKPKTSFSWNLVQSLILATLCMTFFSVPVKAESNDVDTFSSEEILKSLRDLGVSAEAAGGAMAKGIASVIARHGQPTGIIVGSEAQVSLLLGYRKGSGKLLFKGKNPASALNLYWEAPSIGVGTGLTASKVCILVYGTSDSSKLLATFGSAEGSAHWLAGASVSLLSNLAQEEDQRIYLADVAVGAGFDFTARIEGLTFSTENKWLP